jgi:hypothetical protein
MQLHKIISVNTNHEVVILRIYETRYWRSFQGIKKVPEEPGLLSFAL